LANGKRLLPCNFLFPRSKIIELESVGAVLLEKSSRARRLRISITPFKGIRVAVPNGVSFKRAGQFAGAQIPWIAKNLRRIKQIEQEYQKIEQESVQPTRQETRQGRRILINRLHELAQQYGFTFHKVFIRNQATLWGSCSARNNINLNLKLVRLPRHLMDYVILHELAHIKIKNHSRKFWTELANYIPNPQSVSKELKKCGFIDRL
jgi:predicted metal-dependent hydrolase